GSQCTGPARITKPAEAGVRLSMAGCGRYRYNLVIEHLRRSRKHKAICLEEISDGFEARRVVKGRTAFYTASRPRRARDRRTPNEHTVRGRVRAKQHET
ncbi:MAG: hypothetical protein AAGI03_15345, partial [Pseudomonadota bacterium]